MEGADGNIFRDIDCNTASHEVFEALYNDSGLLIERIISTGQASPEKDWYLQDYDEWVIVLQGKAGLLYDDGSAITLSAGDYLLIPGGRKHRVTYTSSDPPCIWLAIHHRNSKKTMHSIINK